MFSYCEIGERQSEVQWNYRKDMCKLFLVGSRPWDTKMFRIIKMYKEIVAAKALMMGPIDLQYKAFIQNKSIRRMKSGARAAGIVDKLKLETFSNRNKDTADEESSKFTYNESSMFSSIEDSQTYGDSGSKFFEARPPRAGGQNRTDNDSFSDARLVDIAQDSIDSKDASPLLTPQSLTGGSSIFSYEIETAKTQS
jgi:hypothetical protein